MNSGWNWDTLSREHKNVRLFARRKGEEWGLVLLK